jgi:hypothetical protein
MEGKIKLLKPKGKNVFNPNKNENPRSPNSSLVRDMSSQ